MGERLIKPYEISVWEDKLIQNGAEYEFKETKLAVIGTDTMTGLNRVYDPIFHKKANGEKTLTFSLKYKYFDPYSGNEGVINPFAALLINERKVKLHYRDEWYEFIVKDHTESSDELTWTYTCTDAFVLELSKNGYNITFNSELDNNQGTAEELAQKTLENTDWQVGETDVLKQYIEEPIYEATLESVQGINIINASKNGEAIPAEGSSIYVFYSHVKNKDGKFVQFIIRDDNREYTIDSKNVITDTNFRITTDLIFENNSFKNSSGTTIISLGKIENRYQANRLAYNQLTTYDSVMQRTVDRFKITGRNTEVYRYTDYKYTTSNVVVNYITNGENFNALEDGTLQGWNPYTDQSIGEVHKLELVTKPELSTNNELAKLSELSSIEGFLKVQFNKEKVQANNKIYNTLYNSGIENHISLIDSIAKGDKFVFRWRAATGNIDNLVPTKNLGLIVAKYTQDLSSFKYYKHINVNDVILDFTGIPNNPSYNYINNGSFQTNQDGTISYVINGVVAIPSTKYIYKSGSIARVWDGTTYVDVNEDTGAYTDSNNVAHIYRPYYYLIATAKQAVSNAELKDRDKRIGIFIYNKASAGVYFLQDIQLTRYYEDETGNPVLVGNAPVATSIPIEYYYLKPTKDTVAEDVQTYASPEALADALGISPSLITPLYNENSEKRLSISVSQSNCFNILQTIAETFECWVDLVVEHDDLGYIIEDEDGIHKYVYLHEYAGKENWAGFKYGINLQSIERNVNSDEIVTKLIVDQSQSDLVEEGYVSIANAPSNQSGESYILNFDYYYNQGLLNREEAEEDKNSFLKSLADKNAEIKKNEKRRIELEKALTTLGSNKTIYSDLVTAAQDTQTRDLDEFYAEAGETYQAYRNRHLSLEPAERKTEDETMYSLISELYTSSATINNYSGLLDVINTQYKDVDEELNGVEGTTNIGLKKEIENLIQEKADLINNFENKYRKYILEGTWNSTDYIDSELYYLDAVQVSNTSAQPIVSYTINVVEVSQLEGLEYYDFDAGDKSYIEDTEFFGWSKKDGILTPAREEVIVSEVEWHLESPEEDIITVQNYKTRFEDLFQRVSAAVQTVQYNEATYAKISSLLDANGTINQDVLVTSLNNIAGKQYNLTSNGSIVIDNDIILVQNLTNPANRVIINSEGIQISSDGGNTYTTAISGEGINAGVVFTGTLNTNNIIIGNSQNPSFRWDKSGISAYKSVPNEPYDLQTYVRYDEYGLYGIKNGEYFKAQSLDDILDKAHFAITWDGFFIKNNYEGGGRVEITSANDFRVLSDPQLQGNFQETIKIGALEWGKNGNVPIISPDEPGATRLPTLYGIRIKNNIGTEVFKTGTDGNIEITGIINATGGNFNDVVNVGRTDQNHIIIDGRSGINSPSIQSSNYSDGAGTGWLINKDGDAVFNNITARGAIKTAVFEYSEIQAVGGIFLFRPSSTIKSARTEGVDLILEVEKPLLFINISYVKIKNPDPEANPHNLKWYEKTAYGYQLTDDTSVDENKEYFNEKKLERDSWCKVSNYISKKEVANPTIQNILENNGLTHVYRVSNVDSTTKEVTLSGAAVMVNGSNAVTTLEELVGGALVDLGRQDGSANYGIGVNSSDNTVNLPARAISLFETKINPNVNNGVKVSYNYRGVLGTLPILEYTGNNLQVNELYHDNLEGTQGIYTDNLYIGNHEQFITFYTGRQDQQKHLKINAKELTFKAGTYNQYSKDPQQNFIYLSNENYPESIAINTITEKDDWRLIIGNKFGVDKAGNLYASNANISGTIYADSGIIGGAQIDENGNLIVDQSQVNNLTADLTQIHNEASIKGYVLAVDADYSVTQTVTLTAHLYYGETEVTEKFPDTMFYWYAKSEDMGQGDYIVVEETEGNPKENGWYEFIEDVNIHILTDDTTIDEEKTYYIKSNPIKPLTNAYSITFDRNDAGYGTTIVCNFAIDDEVLLTTPDNYALATPDEYLLTARV